MMGIWVSFKAELIFGQSHTGHLCSVSGMVTALLLPSRDPVFLSLQSVHPSSDFGNSLAESAVIFPLSSGLSSLSGCS